MRLRLASVVLASFCASGSSAQGGTAGPFDGRWSAVLTCADTTDRNGLVKGYQYTFGVSIQDGVVKGEYGAPGSPASLSIVGQVAADGTLEIAANGQTGRSEYSIGKLAQGTHYSYTMRGRLSGSSGQATRREVRPCTAVLTRARPPVP